MTPPSIAYSSSEAELLIDLDNMEILHASNISKKKHPASLTKLMTIYLLFERIESGRLDFDSYLLVSENANRAPPTKVLLKEGSFITVKDALMSLIVKSANNVAVVVAESLSGTEKNFVSLMNEQAKVLGMKNTTFKNASGLHDNEQVTTILDMFILAYSIIKNYAHYLPLFSAENFLLNGISYKSHNNLLKNYSWIQGMKTGYTKPSGFNIVTLSNKLGRNLLTIVMGSKSASSRDSKVLGLIDSNYQGYQGRFTPKKYNNEFFSASHNQMVKDNPLNLDGYLFDNNAIPIGIAEKIIDNREKIAQKLMPKLKKKKKEAEEIQPEDLTVTIVPPTLRFK